MKRINSVNLEVTNMTVEQERKVLEAANMMVEFFSSDFFFKKIIDTDFISLRGASKSCISRKLLFNHVQIYQLFMSGKEEWNREEDYEIDLKISRYAKWWSRVKGYIIPMKPTIHVNGKFFDSSSSFDVGSNLCHEWSHTLGFRHSGEYLRESLPYLINDWWKEFFNNKPTVHVEPTKYKTVCKRIWLTKRCYKKVVSPTNP